jgi:hypothetical protein
MHTNNTQTTHKQHTNNTQIYLGVRFVVGVRLLLEGVCCLLWLRNRRRRGQCSQLRWRHHHLEITGNRALTVFITSPAHESAVLRQRTYMIASTTKSHHLPQTCRDIALPFAILSPASHNSISSERCGERPATAYSTHMLQVTGHIALTFNIVTPTHHLPICRQRCSVGETMTTVSAQCRPHWRELSPLVVETRTRRPSHPREG